MPISQLFILTPRGDAVVSKDFRGDCPRGEYESARYPFLLCQHFINQSRYSIRIFLYTDV